MGDVFHLSATRDLKGFPSVPFRKLWNAWLVK
jgi:hypothetical protein